MEARDRVLRLEALIQQLHATDYALRKAASSALVAMGEEAVSALLRVAQASAFVARMRAIEALGEIGSPRAFWPLANLLLSEEDYDLIQVRLQALTRIVEKTAAAPTRADAPWFCAILKRFRFDIYTRPVAVAAAQGVLSLAQTDPGPELLPALSLLKGNFFSTVPPEFGTIRKEVTRLLAPWKDLPLPATSVRTESDLPLPTNVSLDESDTTIDRHK